MKLSELRFRRGTPIHVQIDSLQGPPSLTDRLREMGFFEGMRVEVAGKLPFGGPWLVRLGATSFALREDEAACAEVTVTE